MAEVSDDDLERLASRIAMLASESGEADNAGRAVAALARRIGLSGGQLKAFFLAGATEGVRTTPRDRKLPDAAVQIDRLERELSALRHGLKLTEVQARNALRERDALRAENNTLRDALDRSRSGEQVRKFVGFALVGAIVLGGLLMAFGPSLRINPVGNIAEQSPGSPFTRLATIRPGGAVLRPSPDPQAPSLSLLAPGTRVQMHQMIWHGLMQWAEIQVGGITGYVLSTEIDLS